MTLAQAVEDLYTAFATAPRPTQLHQPGYGFEPGELQQLLSGPLRELSPEHMQLYLFGAIYQVSTWDGFRYFLPLLLELLLPSETEPALVAWRLKYA